ncbi:hypothetical protein, partial [Actinomadura roseirufa]|uniref:hypothetical protein n=1 Tax=Actinomadura roseirufa TaxID=2094049 RepID=UPI0013F15A8F
MPAGNALSGNALSGNAVSRSTVSWSTVLTRHTLRNRGARLARPLRPGALLTRPRLSRSRLRLPWRAPASS